MTSGSSLIALHGEPGAGKDAVGKYLVEKHGYTRFAFADRLKVACEALDPIITFEVDRQLLTQIQEGEPPTLKPVRLRQVIGKYGWDEAKRRYPEVGQTQQKLATEVVRSLIDDKYWVDYVRHAMAIDGGPVVITDMRFPNEYDMVNWCGGTSWWIRRKENPYRGARSLSHVSEQWHPDRYTRIDNNSTLDDLHETVERALLS